MTTGYSSEGIHTRIYHRLLDVIPDLLTIEDEGKSEIDGLTALNFDVVQRTPEKLVIMLSHYYRHDCGEMVPNPDMTIAVYVDRCVAEALTYRDAYMNDSVYSSDRRHVDVLAKRVWNDYLHTWLGNLITQGHSIKKKDDDE